MGRFVAIDLSNLPPIDAVVLPDVEVLIAEYKQALLDLLASDATLQAEVAAVLQLESEPLVKIIEAASYRELILLQRINEAVRAVMLPTSRGADLDNLVARLDVVRQRIDATGYVESDADLRYRYQLAPEAFSTAGPYGGYEYLCRDAHPLVKDAANYGPETGLVEPGQTLSVILSREGDGTPSKDILDAVYAKLSHADTVPDTDEVLVRGASIAPYSIRYRLQLRPGADASLIVAEARRRLTAYADASDAYDAAVAAGYAGSASAFADLAPEAGGVTPRRVGGIVALSALDGAAHADRVNVVRAVRLSPTAEVDPGLDGAVYCTSVVVEWEVAP